MTKFDENQISHYKKILANYTYQNSFSQSTSCEDFLSTPLFEIHRATQNIQSVYETSFQEALHIISQNTNSVTLDVIDLKEKNKNIRKIFTINSKQMNELVKHNPSILNYEEKQLLLIRNCLSTKLNFSQQDIYECLINNVKMPHSTDEIVDKFNYIQNHLGYSKSDAITLCRLSSILSLSKSDITQNIDLIQNKLKFNQIADVFPVFNCSFAENINKVNLLTSNNIPMYSIIYLWQITYKQILFQKEYMENKYPSLSSKLFFLPYQDFNKYIYKEKNIINLNASQSYIKKHNTNNYFITFNKQHTQKTNFHTNNKLRLGKRTIITKEDKINAKLLCKSKLQNCGIFIKTRKTTPQNIKINQKTTKLQIKIAKQLQKKATQL